MKIESNRLILFPIDIKYKEDMFKYRSDKVVNKYQSWIPENINDVEKFICKCETEINKPDTWFQLLILEKNEDKIIGDLGLHFLEDDSEVEIGITINRKYHSKHYASEALRRVIEYLFKELKKKSIIASVDPDNFASIRLIENIGFKQKSYTKNAFQINGEWKDDVVYELMK